MIIACPQCETTFSLSDELYRPGKKARCSQCGNVFPMPASEGGALSEDPDLGYGETVPPPQPPRSSSPAGKYKKLIIALSAVLLLAVLAYGAYLVFTSLAPKGSPAVSDVAPDSSGGDAEAEYQQRINSISLDEIRQFLVDNNTLGKIMVIQGVAVNISDINKDFITIEARILDANKRVLAQVRQLCGAPLTLFQLQSLSETELKETLENRITILTNNTNIPPGGKVPFVVFFSSPPDAMRTFEVRVIDVRDSPPAP